MTDPAEAVKAAGNLMTRGTDRVLRRTQQAQAKTEEVAEAASLTSPSGPAKVAAIAASKEQKREEGTTSREIRQKRQVAHAAAEVAEVARLGEQTVSTPLASFKPGEQVDHVTARRLMKQMNAAQRDENRDAAQAAGKAVRNILDGKRPQGASRSRRMAQHAAQQAAINKFA